MRDVKSALYTTIRADAPIMMRLGQKGPFFGRLPKDSPHSRTVAAITFEGDTTTVRGSKDDLTLTLHIWAFSHDLAEAVAADLDRLFHPEPSRYGTPLAVTEGKAFVFREFGQDVPDPDSELIHRVVRLRVRYAKAP